jgi:methyltransferase OMS1
VLLSGTIFFTVCSFYGVSYYKLVSSTPVPTQEDLDSIDLEGVWMKDSDNEAGKVRAMRYDDEINSTEWWAGLYKLRRRLVSEASGDVLESAVGTGRNGEYYAQILSERAKKDGLSDGMEQKSQESAERRDTKEYGKLKSVTLVDVSESMLDVAMDKWQNVMTRADYRHAGGVPTRFVVGDLAMEDFVAVDGLFERRPESAGSSWPRRFDTIIQTNALCSTKHPVVLLRNLAKLVKPDGKILLLEHGRSHYDVVNNVLDRTAVDHAKRHGCLWNRDIERIVSESGLFVEYIKRTSLGTHYYYVLRPSNPVE